MKKEKMLTYHKKTEWKDGMNESDPHSSVDEEPYRTEHWLHLHPLYTKIHAIELDLSTLQRLAVWASNRHVDLAYDHFPALMFKLDAVFTGTQKSFFLRTSYGNVRQVFKLPCTSAREVLQRLILYASSTVPTTSKTQTLFLVPWMDIDPQRDYRAFVRGGKLVAISQNQCYLRMDTLEREAQTRFDAERIQAWISSHPLHREMAIDFFCDNESVRLLSIRPLWGRTRSRLFTVDELRALDGEIVLVRTR